MHQIQDFNDLLGLKGFSDDLLNNHFKLYQGYVAKTNKILELLDDKTLDKYNQAELKRRFGWEFNGMRLHEYYFENLSKDRQQLEKKSKLAEKLIEDFGSITNWQQDFINTGLIRGIGWVILYYDLKAKKLYNCWINEHDVSHLAGAKVILVMDVFEHAFITDYQLDKASYIEAFLGATDWQTVQQRFE